MDELTGARKHATAKLKLRISTALPEAMRPHVRELVAFEVPVGDRKQGYATGLLQQVCDEADKAGLMLLVTVEPFGDRELSQPQLKAWYGKFGFTEIQAEPCLMARMPGSTPRTLEH